METLFGMTHTEADQLLDLARLGVPVHPVLITVALVLTGDIELKNLQDSYLKGVDTLSHFH